MCRSVLFMLVLVALVGGCASPRVKLVRTACDPVERSGRLQEMRFRAQVETRGLAHQQIVYKVELLDAHGKGIRSRDGRFQDVSGVASATRTFFVPQSPWVFDEVYLTIPADQLEMRPTQRPAWARFAICRPNGECLAQAVATLPLPQAPRVARRGRRPAPATATVTPTKKTPPRAIASRPSTRPARTTTQVTTARGANKEQAEADGVRWRPMSWRLAERLGHLRRALTEGPLEELGDLVPGADSPGPAGPETEPTPTSRPSTPTTSPAGPSAIAQVAPPATTSQPTPPAMDSTANRITTKRLRRYVVQSGDTLSEIAARLLGDAERWPEIYALNRDVLVSPDVIAEGMELWLPPEDQSEGRRGVRPPSRNRGVRH